MNHSSEHIRKMIAARSSSSYVRVYTPEYRKKLSDSHRGHIHSEEHRSKISDSMKSYVSSLSDEERQRRVDKWKVLGETNLEKLVFSRLEIVGLPIRKQYWIQRYCVDFYIPDADLVVEANGCYWHGCSCSTKTYPGYDAEYERIRTEFIRSRYKLLIVWEHEIKT